jgi:outer membrane autotransporter protein
LISADPGTGLALIIEERGLDSLASVIGTKFIRSFSKDWGVLTPNLQVEWEHEFKSDAGGAVARFVNDPTGTTIILKDAPTDGDYFRIGLGLSAIMSKGRSGFIYYDRVIGRQGITQDNLTLGLRIEF